MKSAPSLYWHGEMDGEFESLGVLLIEKDPKYISSVRQIFSEIKECELKVISSPLVALESATRWEPNLILFSYDPSVDASVLPRLFARYPSAYILCSLTSADKELVSICIRSGANGILIKTKNYETELLQAIKKALIHIVEKQAFDQSALESSLFSNDNEPLSSLIRSTLQPGETILHYRIVEEIGEGGMGEVYRADDLKLGRSVAIKVLPPKIARDIKMKQRLAREARAASALNHPNIVTIHSIEEASGLSFIVMEYVEGRSLQTLLQSGPLDFMRTLRVGKQVAEALEAAHRIGIIHRDIKPGNIMLTGRDHVKLLDFGLAKKIFKDQELDALHQRRSDLTGVGVPVGTVLYMSPEQTRGELLDERSDIFSLGSVLYEAVTGKLPFNGPSILSVMDAIATAEFPPPSSIISTIPRQFDELIRKSLAKDKSQRFSSAQEFCDALASLEMRISGETAPVSTVPSGQPAVHTRRNPKWLRMATVAAALAIIALIVFALQTSRPLREIRMLPGEKIESLAVLPLVNLSENEKDEYFVDGLTESLIADLAKIPSLKVISRTSIMHYKGTRKSLPEIAKQLKVDAIIEGSVLRMGNRARITAQLIHAASDTHLWAENYDRDLEDILTLQDEISESIAREIQIYTVSENKEIVKTKRAVNAKAFEAYLQGRYQWNKRTKESLNRSVEYFQQAIALDPNYAAAYAALADSWQAMGSMRFLPPDQYLPLARGAAQKAVDLDSSLAEAHASLGATYAHEWRWNEAREQYLKAIDLNPNYATVHHWYSMLLLALNRCDDSIEEIRKARDLDPVSFIINATLGQTLSHCGRYEEALAQFERTKEIDPDHFSLILSLISTYERSGNYPKAIELREQIWLQQGLRPPEAAARRAQLQKAFQSSAEKGYWQTLLENSSENPEGLSKKTEASFHAMLGNIDRAFECLEEAYKKHESDLFTIQFWPELRNIRSDPRYADLIERMGFTKVRLSNH